MTQPELVPGRTDVTLARRVADEIREKILNGKLAIEQPLRQTALAAQLGVSSIPLREALRQLEAEGLVEIHPYRGAIVTHLSATELMELGNIMAGLEIQALRVALPHLTEKELARAAQLSARRAATRDPIRAADLNYEFHTTLYAPGRSPRLLELIRLHHVMVRRYINEFYSEEEEAARPPDSELLDACRCGNAEEAVAVLRWHIMEPVERLCRLLLARRAASDSPGS